MNITQDLIEQFFQDKCNLEEAEAVIVYLNEHPDILKNYLSEEDLNNNISPNRLHPAITEKMLAIIQKSTYKDTKFRYLLRYAAIAAILVSIVFGHKYFASKNENIIVNSPIVITVNSPSPNLKVVRNNSKVWKKIPLQDGSIVELAMNSELSYFEPFEKDKRSLYLIGQATFTVTKDKTKPFSVYSDEISTTALGTKFSVTAFAKASIISVKLIEGQVVVKQTENSKKIAGKDFYLVSGDEFRYNRKTMFAKVYKPLNLNEVISHDPNKEEKIESSNWYMFNNQSLEQVFEQLSAIYNVKIDYSTSEINSMNFIGKIDKTDSIENILKDIAILNNLSVKKDGKKYFIRRKK